MADKNSTPSPSKLTPNGAPPSSKPNKEETARSEEKLPDQVSSPETNLQNLPWKAYWNTLNLVQKRDFFKVSSSDLLTFSQKFSKAQELLIEALTFAQYHEKWNYWMCCCCNTKFADSESHFQHIVGSHLNYCYSPSPELASLVFPLRIQDDWISMINFGTWKPANTTLVFVILEKNLGLLQAKKAKGEEIHPYELKEFDPKQWARGYFFHRNWPLSNDSKREDCLSRIQTRLQTLLSDELLLARHLNHVIHHAMVKLQPEFNFGSLFDLGLYKSHLCICLLDAPELEEIIRFLDVLKKKMVVHVEDEEVEHSKHSNTSFDTDVTIALKNESLDLIWDEYSLCDGTTKPDMNAPYLKSKEAQNLDSLLSWIFLKPPEIQKPDSWANLREERILLGRKELLNFQKILEKRKEEASGLEECIKQLANYTGNAFANNAQLLGKANWTLKLTEDIRRFESTINNDVAAADYRSFLLFLMKAYFEFLLQDKLKRVVSNDNRHVPENVATAKHDGGNSSPCNCFVGASQTTDNEKHSFVLEGNDVHPTVGSERNPESCTVSEYLEYWAGIKVGKKTEKSSDISRWTGKAGEMGIGNEKDLPGENTQRGKASIEADVRKENLSSLQEEWSDAKHQWHKSMMDFQNKVDKGGALPKSVLQKRMLEAGFQKLVLVSQPSQMTSCLADK